MDFEQLQKQSDLVFNSLMNEADNDPIEALRMFHMGEFVIDNNEIRDFIEELLLELADEEQQ